MFNCCVSTLQRKATPVGTDNKSEDALDGSDDTVKSLNLEKSSESQSSLVFGYLNLFSDGVVSKSFHINYVGFSFVSLRRIFCKFSLWQN